MTSGLTIERHNRQTVITIDDSYFAAVGITMPSSPTFALPADFVSKVLMTAADLYKSETRPAHLWAAEQKRKLMLKKFPFLRYAKGGI